MKQKYPQLGAWLSNFRIQAGFNTQSDFAKVIEMGQQTVSRWESGASRPKSDQILKLADLLKTDPKLLLDAAGYTKTLQESPAILSFDKPFPFMSLPPESFERFCCDLLSKVEPTAKVQRWGGAGHKQEGIDIKVDHSDGSIHTYQCKRETEFGPQKVKEAIGYQSIVADKKYIVLARAASPQARQEANRHDDWDILDQDDLSRMVRNLSKNEQKYLVDIYFVGQRMALLGEQEPGIWRNSSSHFAPFMNPSIPLNHTLSLVGRDNEAQNLYDACINTGSQNDNSKRIIYLVGRAGIGKSRLMKHVIDKIEKTPIDTSVWIWDGTSTITSRDLESFGQGRKLLVVDGSKEVKALIPLLDFALRNKNITLLVATRFDEYDRLKSEAVDVGIFGALVEEIRLNPLSESETEKIALEILKLNQGNENMAKHIAKWTTDSPLVAVLSTHLALRETIPFAKVRGHKEYKDLIKGFNKLLVGEVGQKNDQAPIHQILKVLALVQPLDIHNDRLVKCIGSLEPLDSPTIKRLFRLLVEGGVLWKNQNNEYRLSPETVSDIIIEETCLGVENNSTGYADEVFKALDIYAPEYISNLIYNLSRFEWIANMHVTDTVSLLDSIWSNLQDSEDDIEIIDRVAYYQPQRTIDSIEKMMIARLEENVRPNSFSDTTGTVSEAQDLELYDKHSQEYLNKLGKDFVCKINNDIQSIMNPKSIFDDLTPIIQTVVRHKDFLAQACSILWEMSKNYAPSSQSLNANYNHPIRILEEIFSYKPDKPQEDLTVVIDWAIDLLKTYNAVEDPFSPFDFLGEIMKTDVSTMEVSGHSITTTGFTINNYEFVAPLRSKVIDAFLKTLLSSNIQKSYDAAKFLQGCLTYSKNDNCPWTQEAINTLDKLNYVVKNEKINGYALIALNLEIDQLLLKKKYAITRLLRDIQTQINKTIQNDQGLSLSAVMMGSSYGFLWYNEKYKIKIEFILKYDDRVQKFIEFYSSNPNGRQILELFRFNPLTFPSRRFFRSTHLEKLERFQKHISKEVLTPITVDFLNEILATYSHSSENLYHLINQNYLDITSIDPHFNTSSIKRFIKRICETNLDFSEHCVQQALNPQANDNLWQFAWISLSMLLHYDRSNGQEYAEKLLKSSDKNQRELVGQAYGNLSMKEYQLNDSDNAVFTQILNDPDEAVILSGLIFIKNIAYCDGNYPKALDLLIRIRKDVSPNIIVEMFEIVRHTPLKYYSSEEIRESKETLLANQDMCNLIKGLGGDPAVSTRKTKEQAQAMFPKKIFEELCQYLIILPRIPFEYNDGIEAFLMKIIDLYPEIVLDLVLDRAEYAVKNKLLERTFFPSYQIIAMQFLNRETDDVLPKDHRGVKNSRTLLSALRNIPNVKDRINQWLDDHNDESKSYENVKQFLQVEILGKPLFDKKTEKLLAANTEHVFKEARDYISKKLPSIGDKGWLTHDEVDKSIKDFNSLVRDAFIAPDKLDNQEESNFAKSKWRTSSENQKFEEEVKPLYALFKGYPKAYHRTFNHSIDSFDTQAIIIPCNSPDNTKIQRYTLQLLPLQEKPAKVKVPNRIKLCGDREQYDGCIEFSDGLQQKIEVTVANKGAEQGKIKENMRQNGYAMHPMNDDKKVAEKCLQAIKNKLDAEKHKDKYSECWLMVVLNGWQLEGVEGLESFLHFFKEVMQKESYIIDWTKIKSIIIYPGS